MLAAHKIFHHASQLKMTTVNLLLANIQPTTEVLRVSIIDSFAYHTAFTGGQKRLGFIENSNFATCRGPQDA